MTMDVGFSPFLLLAAGAVADVGNLLSATALMAREFAIPAVVDTRLATRVLATGDLIEIDGDAGVVRRQAAGDEAGGADLRAAREE